MNLKDFKKVHEDDQKAVLQNGKGHSFTIAKKSISKKHLDALKGLPLHAADGAALEEDQVAPTAPPVMETPQAAPTDGLAQSTMTQPTDGVDRGLASVDNKPAQTVSTAMPEAPAAEQPQAQPTEAAQNYRKSYDETVAEKAATYGREAAMFNQDLISGHITPQTYGSLFAKRDTVGKIGTLFGLMLSGAGSGLSNQPNAVLTMMNKQIDDDLRAQEKSKDNAQNWLRINQQAALNKASIERTGQETKLLKTQTTGAGIENQGKALENAKLQMQLALVHSLEDNTNKLPASSPLKTTAVNTLNGLKQVVAKEAEQNIYKTAAQEAALEEAGFQKKQKTLMSMEMLGMPGAAGMHRSNQELHVPGYGNASNPVPEPTRQELIGKKAYNDAAKEYISFAKKHSLNVDKLDPRVINQGKALAANVQNKYREKNNGGVWKAGEQDFIETSVPSNPSKWSAAFNAIPKIEETITNNEMDTRNLAKGYGLKFDGFEGGSKEADKSPESETKTMNGAQYKKVNGGWKKVK